MNADRLLAHYEQIADAPDAIAHLRRFILDLAVRGRLVEQDSADEPASELLKRIAAAKARLVRDGEIRRPRVLPDVARDEQLIKPPQGWNWTRLGGLTLIAQGFAFSSEDYSNDSNDGPPLIKIGDIGSDVPNVFIKNKFDPGYIVNPGELLLGLSGSIKCAVWQGPPALLNQRIARIRPATPDLTDAWLFLSVRACIDKWKDETSKLTVQNIKSKQLNEAPVLLPPLAEQHRIVAKVDELMALCDRLEAARAEREATRDRLTAASLARLDAPDPSVFKGHAAFVLENFAPLTTRLDQIKALRQTILNLAVRGKLVDQDPNDEPVSELLDRRRIAVSRAGPFELPASWAWVNVGAVAVARLGKMLDKAKNKGTPRRYLRNVNVRWFDFDLSDLREMRFEDSELPEFTLRFGDVLICEGGEPGRAAVWDDRENDIYFQKAIHRIRFLNIVDSEFFVKALRASADDGRLAKYFTGTGIKHFTGKGLAAYLFPLPPLAEQHRIVAKVDELMAVFDRIVASLASGNDTRRHLLNALLHEALSLSEEKIWKDISTIAQRTAGRTTRIARSVDRANIGRDII